MFFPVEVSKFYQYPDVALQQFDECSKADVESREK